jgi:hypothetical protein
MIPMLWESLRHLHNIKCHMSAVANDIDDLGCGIDWAPISEKLQERQGVSLRKLRECCDEIININREEWQRAKDWEEKHMRGETQ